LVFGWGEILIGLSMLRNRLALEITQGPVPTVDAGRRLHSQP